MGRSSRDGILSDPIDLDRRRPPRLRTEPVPARAGLVVEHRASGVVGSIRSFNEQIVVLRDRFEVDRPLRNQPGGFLVDGEPATLIAPAPVPRPAAVTASGSVAAAARPARVARASRILVEGIHDAELVEKVWGDDLRELGVVVERLDGMDDLADVVRDLDPGPGRRLGVLLDHLVDGSKESRAAAQVRHPHVLVTGTPFVDVWAAIRPGVVGHRRLARRAPRRAVEGGRAGRARHRRPPGRVLEAAARPGADLRRPRPSLVGAVEQLIDFVVDRRGLSVARRAIASETMSDTSHGDPLTVTIEDGVTVVRLDDGKVNVISHRLIELLHGALDRAVEETTAVAILGREGKLSAGFDLTEMTAGPSHAAGAGGRRRPAPHAHLRAPPARGPRGDRPRPGRGALLTLSCDTRIGGDGPAKIGLNETSIGMGLPHFAVELAEARLASSHLMRATVQAEIYDAPGAVEAGYLDRVVPAADVEADRPARGRPARPAPGRRVPPHQARPPPAAHRPRARATRRRHADHDGPRVMPGRVPLPPPA